MELRTLVLNNQFSPLSIWPLYTISAKDAIVRYLTGNCDVIYFYDRRILTPSRKDLYWPSVIINHSNKHFKKNEVSLKKTTLYYRDHGLCAYCGDELNMNTIKYEHVVPRSKGGKHHWENIVAACEKCNSQKGDKDPIGKWKPKHKLYTPSYYDLFENRKKFPIMVDDDRWSEFLPGFTKIIKKD